MTHQSQQIATDTGFVPDTVVNMATTLEARLLEGSETPLAAMLEQCSNGDMQSALERWIMEQLDFGDPEIADAVFHVLERRIARKLWIGSRSL